MTRYADPQRCPDCRGPIEYGARSCPTCDLPLEGPTAGRLFSTLAQADELLGILRAGQVPVVQPSPAPVATPPPVLPAAPSGRSGLNAASVPKILLGLGAGCLLVAALVFLAVTWSVMGVAGRTATLAGFTVVAGALAAWMARRNLRAAAESLAVVALGLLAFDLFGARDSGWLGDLSDTGFLILLGAVLAVVGAGAGLAVRRTPIIALAGAEIVSALGLAAMCAGISEDDRVAPSAGLILSVALGAAAAFAADRLRLVVLAVGAAVVSGCVWLILVATSLERAFDHPTAGELWLDLEVWPLLAAAALIGALALVSSLPAAVRVAGVAVAELIIAVVVLVPFTQGTSTDLTLAVLGVLAASCVLTWFAPTPWSQGCAATSAATGLWMLGVAGVLSLTAFGRVADAGAFLWDGSPDGRLPGASDGDLAAWLLPVAVVAFVGAAAVLARASRSVDQLVAPLADPVLGIGLVAAAAVGTVASYPVPVWLVCALLLLCAVLFSGWALPRLGVLSLAVGGVFLCGAMGLALYDEWLTAFALFVGLALSAAVFLRWSRVEVRIGVGFLAAAWLAGSIWAWAAVLDAEETWASLTVLVLLAALVLVAPLAGRARVDPQAPARPASPAGSAFLGVEVGSAVSMLVFALAGLAAAPDAQTATWTAVYLTVAGAAVAAMSLLREDRRELGWVGGLLLAMASWVRLWDIGVETPEAYTVPVAVALTLVGLVHLRRFPDASTMTALGPGLALGLVPSLLWVLWEPATMRSVLLGAACLLLLVAGARMRWTAPVVLAASVGALVVLRHAAPFVDQAVPRWALIATAGTILVSMGITWERRIQEARAVAGYVRTLR